MELSDDEKAVLRLHSRNANRARHDAAGYPDVADPDSDEPLSYEWRSDSGGKVTQEMCNAIRCAAFEGVPYPRIAELFDTLRDRRHAHKHATGSGCAHDGVQTVSAGRSTASVEKITAADCKLLRRRYEDGRYDTYREAGEDFGVTRTAVKYHLRGECKH